jgi:hypothetical protein
LLLEPAPQAFLALHTQPEDNGELLGELALARAELAGSIGFPSYAQYQVSLASPRLASP